MSEDRKFYYIYKPKNIEVIGNIEELPEKVVWAEYGWLGAYRFHGIEPTFYEYVPAELVAKAEDENDGMRALIQDMYREMHIRCQFGLPVPPGTMAHIKNRIAGFGIEVDD